jgi:polycystin 1L2
LKISTIDEYWKWLEESFVSNLRAQQWYNGDSPRNLSGFINDKTNRIIGWANMRQLRIKSDLCSIEISNSTICEYDYSFFNEERNSFEPGWENETEINLNSTIDQAFQYKSKNELDTYVYQGYNSGGYVYEFRGRLADIQSNLSELHQLGWIDSRTRAIIIQLSLFNPNVQLFVSVTLLTEFSSIGGVYPQSQFEPMNFYGKHENDFFRGVNFIFFISIYINHSIGLYDYLYDIHRLFHVHGNLFIFSIKIEVYL